MQNRRITRYSAVYVDRIALRGGGLETSLMQLCVGIWNAEGLTDAKK